ncbi:pentapeptide repeat-containing protein [Pseudoalteromonas obscura]|uniref:Pentapeptide repeat-containing protein n=1 Tax=Pseudoalteromonas obscura TaxID=3048491 RepID=A0ABT7EQB5_9GAMM|nr:pentapeptide repeat-containing protein [Pseudoalteromonas sp. P94(2023)]MDK2597250.1 pentapeptide repeat-containing protein [Pseudoalteromonas sp. P94(2023)]
MNKCCYVHKEITVGEETWDPEKDGGDDCQYSKIEKSLAEIEYFTVDGKVWCEFHCPIFDKNGHPTLKSKWSDERKDEFEKKLFLIAGKSKDVFEHDRIDYSGTIFNIPLDFSSCIHNDYPNFSYCIFYHEVDFSECRFTGDVTFRGTVFHKEVSFYKTRFDEGLDFISCTFYDSFNVQFSLKSTFEDNEERELIKSIDFKGCTFFDQAKFDNRKFKGHSDFTACIFHKAPTFFNCELHQETDFPPFSNFLDTAPKAIKAYRVLKLSMENVRNRHDEASFFALEQLCIRKSKKRMGYISIGYLYELSSLYGLSTIRPLIWVTIVTAASFLLYFIAFHMQHNYGLEAVDFAMKQIFRPFSIWSHKETMYLQSQYKINTLITLKLMASVQSILTFSLLSIFFITIRWKFKRG